MHKHNLTNAPLIATLLATFVSMTSSAYAAQEPKPAFQQPEVLKAALVIGLTEKQKPQFRDAITNFVNKRIRAIGALVRRGNQTNLERKIKSKTNRYLKEMDKEMDTFLTSEQLPAYEDYRDKLKRHLRGGQISGI